MGRGARPCPLLRVLPALTLAVPGVAARGGPALLSRRLLSIRFLPPSGGKLRPPQGGVFLFLVFFALPSFSARHKFMTIFPGPLK